jgi:DNA modification methylase
MAMTPRHDPPKALCSTGMVVVVRRALTNVGGKIEIERGSDTDRTLLNTALDARADDPDVRGHLHGFHAYPARLHPVTARRLVEGLVRPGECALDPFCGSGTMLVEALAAGRDAAGLDANPLAVMLASYKLHKTGPAERQQLVEYAKTIAEAAEARRKSRAGPSRRYPVAQARQFDPHMLLELDGLLAGIRQVTDRYCQEGLMLVLSSIANKVSRQTSDTVLRPSQRRLAAGFAIRLFHRKAQELARRQAEFAALIEPRWKHQFDVRLGDARRLPFRNGSFAGIITSPPYPGIYDYVEHHRLRLQWLGLDVRYLERHEIGARRQIHSANSSHNTYPLELELCLKEMARVLRPKGTVALVIADTVIDERAWYADEAIESIARSAGLALVAAAAQTRPHFHRASAFGPRPRCERLLLLRHK